MFLKSSLQARLDMRTKQQRNCQNGPPSMLDQIKIALTRDPATLARDLAGVTALMVILVAGLFLPGLV
jgi:hypothetical protein